MDSSKTEESTGDYSEGGYHPVEIGDCFNRGRYVVQSQLGCGTFSTVWLAWDTQLKKYVALKIVKSAPRYIQIALREIDILTTISLADPDDKEYVVKLLDTFRHSGPNGKHICMVLELLGDDLRTLLKFNNGHGFPLHMVKEICFHVLAGLDYLHSRHSIIHTDLKPENILLPSTIDPSKDPRKLGVPLLLPSNRDKSVIPTNSYSASHIGKTAIERLTGNQVKKLRQMAILGAQVCGAAANGEEEKLGVEAQAEKTKTWGSQKSLYDAMDGTPLQNYRKVRNCNLSEKKKLMASLDLKCKIADLGNACWTHDRVTGHIQTPNYRCPETLLRADYSTSADIWSVACIAFELATGAFLFNPRGRHNKHNKVENHLALMMELLGVMPKTVALGGKLSNEFFDRNGCLKGKRKLEPWPLVEVLQDRFCFAEKDANDFSDFLVPLLDFEPEKRPTAMQALLHPWINGGPRLLPPSSSSSAQTQESDEVIPEEKTTV